MRKIVLLVVVLALAAAPRPAEAGFKSSVKKAAVKVGHVMENVVYVAAGVVAVIAFCKAGGCD